MTQRYPVPLNAHRTEQIIERSRFIITIGPASSVEAARAFVYQAKAELSDATHNCWAYLVGAPGSTAHIGLSDDGEPPGTAGKPMLQVLLGSNIGDVVAVVTRYFGGVKLGTGGLVRAYSNCVKFGLTTLPVIEKVERARLKISLPYRFFELLQRLLPDFEAQLTESSFDTTVHLSLTLPAERVAAFEVALTNLTAGLASTSLE